MAVALKDVLRYDTRDDSQDRELEYPPTPSDPELEKIDEREDRGSDYSPTKRKRKNSSSESQRGKKKPPRLTREARSNIRFMSKYGVADSTMAERLHITQRRIEKAINNGYNPPDNLDSDDDHVSREVAERFPRKANAAPASPPVPPPPRPTAKAPQRSEPGGQSSNSRKINSGPNCGATPIGLNARAPGSRLVTVHQLLCNLQPPMPQLLQPLGEAGITDETLPGIVQWQPEQTFEFFEELIKSKVLDRLQSFLLKRALVELAASRKK